VQPALTLSNQPAVDYEGGILFKKRLSPEESRKLMEDFKQQIKEAGLSEERQK